MFSKVSICSGAALLLGEKPFNSFNDKKSYIQMLDKIYDDILLTELSSYMWDFATRYQKGNIIKQTDPRYIICDIDQNQFAYPNDAIAIRSISQYRGCTVYRYAIKDGVIFTHANEIDIIYITRPTEDTFPSSFVTMLKYLLTEAISMAVTGDMKLTQLMYTRVIDARKQAHDIDRNQVKKLPQLNMIVKSRYVC